MLKIENLSVGFDTSKGRFTVLDGLSYHLKKGEILAVVVSVLSLPISVVALVIEVQLAAIFESNEFVEALYSRYDT